MDRPIHNHPTPAVTVRSKSLDLETFFPSQSLSHQRRDPQIHYHHRSEASHQHYRLQNTPKKGNLYPSRNKI